jgi:hypothetical protein
MGWISLGLGGAGEASAAAAATDAENGDETAMAISLELPF